MHALWRLEAAARRRDNRREQDQDQYADDAPRAGGRERQLLGARAFAFLGHFKAVKCRRDIRRGAGNFQKYCAHRAAGDCRSICRAKQNKTLHGREMKGKENE